LTIVVKNNKKLNMLKLTSVDLKYYETLPLNFVITQNDELCSVKYASKYFLSSLNLFEYNENNLYLTSIIADKDAKEFKKFLNQKDIDAAGKKVFQLKSSKNRQVAVFIQSVLVDEEEYKLFLISCEEENDSQTLKLTNKYNELKSVLDVSTILAITDSNGIITEVNNHFCNISGYNKDELLGRTHNLLNSGFHSRDFFSKMWKTISSGEIWKGEIKNKKKDGTFYWVSTTIVPLKDSQNNPLQFISIRYDISKQKEVEQSLLDKEKHLQAFISSIGDIVLEVDENYIFRDVIAKREENLFMPKKQFLNKSILEVFDDEMGRRFTKIIDEVIRTGVRKEIEYQDWVNNSNKWYLANVNLISTQKELKRLSIIIRDISTVKMAQQALAESEEKLAEKDKLFRLISENSGDWISLQDINGKWVYNSPSIERITGYTSNEIEERNFSSLIVEEDYALKYQPALIKVQSTGEIQVVEYRFISKNNDEKWFETIFSAVVEDEILTHIQKITRNITERKRVEEQLKKAENLAKIGSWELNLKTNQLFWSDETHRIFELPIIPDVVSYENFSKLVHPDDKEILNEAYYQSIDNKEPYDFVHRILLKNGKIKYVHEKGETYYDSKGEPLNTIGTVQDVTQLQLIKNELIELNEKLEEKVIQRTNELLFEKESRSKIEKEKDENDYNYKVLYDHVPTGIAVYEQIDNGKDFLIIDFNQTALAIDHRKREEVVGLSIKEVYPEIENTILLSAFKRVYQSGKTETIPSFYYKDDRIEGWRANDVHKLPSGQIVSVFKDISLDVRMENELKNSILEKETLLDEIHHRVKNNLQVILGLLNLQQMGLNDKNIKKILLDSERRIRAMSLVHELIYQHKNYSEVDMSKYFHNLTSFLSESFETNRVALNLNIETCYLSVNTSSNLGIIITEIMTNIYKYAFVGDVDAPEINISMKQLENEAFLLIIEDNGAGFEKENKIKTSKSLGISLIFGMVSQIKGKVELTSDENGTKYEIIFKDNKK
jgi:PAS domain S-box-containing protein